jgi:hypothetical protein
MSTIELKSHIIKLVEDIQNDDFLELLLEFLSKQKDSSLGDLWSDLTAEQKQEVLNAYDESEKDENLIEKEKLFRFIK